MAVDVQGVCLELETAAAIFGAIDNQEEAAGMSGGEIQVIDVFDRRTGERHPENRLIYRMAIGSCKLKLVMAPERDAILYRAEQLKKTARAVGLLGTYRKPPRQPSLKRAKRSRAVAQGFLNDFEKDNWEAYDDLYR